MDEFNRDSDNVRYPDANYTYNSSYHQGRNDYSYHMHDDWAPHEPKKPKRQGRARTWIARCILVIVVAAVAFGSAYMGNLAADKNARQVIIQQVTSSSGSSAQTTVAGNGALTSEQVAEKAVPSVVAITTEKMITNNYWFGTQVVSGAGSGVIISEDGYIVTNYHVAGNADNITVELHDGSTYPAELVGSYMEGDLAVIKIDATGLKPAVFADSDKVKQGQQVYAIGNPTGRFSGSITGGMISAIERNITVSMSSGNSGGFGGFFGYNPYLQKTITLSVFQFDAAVSPGNSGGGLFNDRGELIGIVCAKSADSDTEGLGFAITGNNALEVATAIITTGSYTDPNGGSGQGSANTNKALLGITAIYLDEQTAASYGYSSAGVYVASVTAQSTAEAGLSAGDRIISIDGVIISQVSDVTDYLAEKSPGDQVQLAVERKGRMLTLEITLIENTSAKK